MNTKAWVGFGFYGAANTTQRANLYSSWGLRTELHEEVLPVIYANVRKYHQRLIGWIGKKNLRGLIWES
jgi:hypothetical protein